MTFTDDEIVGLPRSFFHKFSELFSSKISKKQDAAMLLVTSFATVSQNANHCQISCCII